MYEIWEYGDFDSIYWGSAPTAEEAKEAVKFLNIWSKLTHRLGTFIYSFENSITKNNVKLKEQLNNQIIGVVTYFNTEGECEVEYDLHENCPIQLEFYPNQGKILKSKYSRLKFPEGCDVLHFGIKPEDVLDIENLEEYLEEKSRHLYELLKKG